MNNFYFHNPTKVYFGDGEVEKVGTLSKSFGNTVLLVYGKSSIKKMGLYDKVIALLEKENITVYELAGIDPNPRIESVRKGAEICKKHQVDLVLGVGGGSVIDASKAIAAAALYDKDPWDFFAHTATCEKALPVGAILTLAATGTELNPFAVITNFEVRQKNGWGSEHVFPKFSILDPKNTYSVNKHQTGCGIVDTLTHVYENYFSKAESYLTDRIAEGIMKTVVQYGPIALEDPTNYEARANLMFASSLALHGVAGFAKVWDGFEHTTEHVLSAFYDIAHADGLSILGPHWMRYVLDESNVDKFYDFAVNVWGVAPSEDKMHVAQLGINCVFDFYKSLDMPLYLKDVEIINPDFEDIATQAIRRTGSVGNFKKLSKHDVINILKNAE